MTSWTISSEKHISALIINDALYPPVGATAITCLRPSFIMPDPAIAKGKLYLRTSDGWEMECRALSSSINSMTWIIIALVVVAAVVIVVAVLFAGRRSLAPSESTAQTKFIEWTGQIAPICPTCGRINDGSMFCGNCGRK